MESQEEDQVGEPSLVEAFSAGEEEAQEETSEASYQQVLAEVEGVLRLIHQEANLQQTSLGEGDQVAVS
jgi:hypothetical protein